MQNVYIFGLLHWLLVTCFYLALPSLYLHDSLFKVEFQILANQIFTLSSWQLSNLGQQLFRYTNWTKLRIHGTFTIFLHKNDITYKIPRNGFVKMWHRLLSWFASVTMAAGACHVGVQFTNQRRNRFCASHICVWLPGDVPLTFVSCTLA